MANIQRFLSQLEESDRENQFHLTSFLLCAEGFSCTLKMIGASQLKKVIRVGILAPWVSHLLFAHDSIIFTHASQEGADRLQMILDRYQLGSGQMVNKDKSAIFFSSTSDEQMKHSVNEGTGISTEALVEIGRAHV